MMTVGELKKMLIQYPDDMEILHDRYSDYCLVNVTDWSVIKAVQQDSYIMRSHPTMSQENKNKEKEYLHLVGN